MYASTGKDNSTPKGTFEIQTERGQFFYNSKSGEGAHYWTSFKDHGIYLFHTVPTNRKGHYLKDEAKRSATVLTRTAVCVSVCRMPNIFLNKSLLERLLLSFNEVN